MFMAGDVECCLFNFCEVKQDVIPRGIMFRLMVLIKDNNAHKVKPFPGYGREKYVCNGV